ncbi:MAG: glycosyltransferase family 2 protein [Planctomycetes bacterium]|nr:glycosyltransferase family 2 protein [Planctomycetota bacterium]
MIAAGWILLMACALALAFWIMVMIRIRLSAAALPKVTAGLAVPAPAAGWPRLSIVVPIHNEESRIDRCVASLRKQEYPNLQIVLSLDRCTDGTLAILQRHAAEDPRVRIVEITQPREGWQGKCLPMQVGSEHADGEWILFVDADTQMHRQLARASIGTVIAQEFDMLGVLPELRCTHLFEHVAQPVATMQLMNVFPPTKVNRKERSRPFGLGPFMMVRRALYERAGRMENVKHEYQDDVYLARAMHAAGGRVGLAASDGLFSCAMYESYESFHRGWKRIYIGCLNKNVKRLQRYGRRILTFGVVLPLIQLSSLAVGAMLFAQGHTGFGSVLVGAVVTGWVLQVAALVDLYRMGGTPWYAVFTYPAGCWMVGKIMLESAADLKNGKPINWGGREYVVKARGV